MTTIAALLAQARTDGLDRLDAQLLLAHVLGRPRPWLIAHDTDAVDVGRTVAYRALCRERIRGVPVAYLVGTREFHGLTLQVTDAVLVPRPETEILVDWALELLAGPLSACGCPQVADLGTGSGAVALAVKKAHPPAQVLATDVCPAALAVARANAARLGIDVEFVASDWFAGLAGRRFHLVLSNPPYVDAGDPLLAALHAEPALALTPGADGLAALHAIVEQAPAHLRQGGWLVMEHGSTQAPSIATRLAGRGFVEVRTRADLAGLPRCSGGRWPGRDN